MIPAAALAGQVPGSCSPHELAAERAASNTESLTVTSSTAVLAVA